jgi:hypothetical protein
MESATCISFHVNCRFTHTIQPRSRLATIQSAEIELSLMRLTIRLYLRAGELCRRKRVFLRKNVTYACSRPRGKLSCLIASITWPLVFRANKFSNTNFA